MAFVVLAAAACTVQNPRLAVISDTTETVLPAGFSPAWIVEIAGRRVTPERRIHYLDPGVVRVGLRPVVEGPPDQTPLRAGANRDGEILYLDLDLRAGRRYELGLKEDLAGTPEAIIVRESGRQ
jgi:hypothetical protein